MQTTPYRLFYAPGSCSLSAHVLLEELGVPFEAIAARSFSGETLRPDWLELNPRAQVPVLVGPDGVLTECIAILASLAETHAPERFLPSTGTRRFQVLSWMSHLATNLHHAFNPLITATRQGDAEAIAEAKPKLVKLLGEIEQELGSKEWLLSGTQPTLADLQLFTYENWARFFMPAEFASWPKLAAHAARMLSRPAVQRALGREFPNGPPSPA